MPDRDPEGRVSEGSIGRLFLVLAGVFGIAVILVTPPFQIPDENAHFLRAASLARGQLLAIPTPGGPGGPLPASLVDLTAGPWEALRSHPEVSLEPREVATRLTRRSQPDPEVNAAFPEPSRYSPVSHLPQAGALLLARALRLPPLLHYLLGRLAALTAWCGLVWVALRVAPGFRWTLAFLALTPMSLFLAGSHSADVMTNALATLLVALALRATAASGPLRRAEAAILLSVAAALLLTKPYLPLLLLLWLVPRERLGGRWAAAGWRVGGPLLCLLPAALWYLASSAVLPALPPGAEPGQQIAWLSMHPVEAAGILLRSTLHQSASWAHQFVGVLGWLDTRLPRPLVLAEGLLILAVPLVDRVGPLRLGRGRRLLLAAAFAVTALGLILQAYLRWVPVGSPVVQGVQGRYFIPIAPLALLPIAGLAARNARPWWLPAAFAVHAALLAWTVWALAARYYGLHHASGGIPPPFP